MGGLGCKEQTPGKLRFYDKNWASVVPIIAYTSCLESQGQATAPGCAGWTLHNGTQPWALKYGAWYTYQATCLSGRVHLTKVHLFLNTKELITPLVSQLWLAPTQMESLFPTHTKVSYRSAVILGHLALAPCPTP